MQVGLIRFHHKVKSPLGPAPSLRFHVDGTNEVTLLPGGYGQLAVGLGTHRSSVTHRGRELAALDVNVTEGEVVNVEYQAFQPSPADSRGEVLVMRPDDEFQPSRFTASEWRRQLLIISVAVPVLTALIGIGVVSCIKAVNSGEAPQAVAGLVVIMIGAWLFWRLPYTGIRVRYYEIHRNGRVSRG